MDLAEIARVMRRRWYVLLPGVLLTLAMVVGVSVLVPSKYQSQATVELLNSQKATVPFDGNPFLSTQTSLTGMADSLARNINADQAQADLKALGVTGTASAQIADNAQAPLLWLTVVGTDKQAVLSSDQTLLTYATQRLTQFQQQQNVPANAMIRMTTIVAPQTPAAQTKTKIEYLSLAGVLGVVLSMVATFYVEARRRTRPAAAVTGTAVTGDPVTGAAVTGDPATGEGNRPRSAPESQPRPEPGSEARPEAREQARPRPEPEPEPEPAHKVAAGPVAERDDDTVQLSVPEAPPSRAASWFS